MSDEGLLRAVPSERTDAELDDGELFGGVFGLEVANVEAVALQGLSPRGAGDAGHLEVDRHEVRVSDEASEVG